MRFHISGYANIPRFDGGTAVQSGDTIFVLSNSDQAVYNVSMLDALTNIADFSVAISSTLVSPTKTSPQLLLVCKSCDLSVFGVDVAIENGVVLNVTYSDDYRKYRVGSVWRLTATDIEPIDVLLDLTTYDIAGLLQEQG